jgi:hypothetical protein
VTEHGSEATPEDLDRVLRAAGATDHLMAWWPAGDTRPHVRATVTVTATSVNAALSAVMVAVHEAPSFSGAEITYDVDRGAPPARDRLPDTELTIDRADEDEGDPLPRR